MAKKGSSRKKARRRRNPAGDLTGRDIIAHPDHRGRLPQTLAGVFYLARDERRFPEVASHFVGVGDPSLSFLPGCERFKLVDSCGGLLLCRCFLDGDLPDLFCYVVCNPATESWLPLPDTLSSCGDGGRPRTAFLAFDPAVSSHFDPPGHELLSSAFLNLLESVLHLADAHISCPA